MNEFGEKLKELRNEAAKAGINIIEKAANLFYLKSKIGRAIMLRSRKIHTKYLLLVLMSFCLFGCGYKRNYIKTLSANNRKFWRFNLDGDKDDYYGICLHADKTLQMYTIQRDGSGIVQSLHYSSVWKIVNDSTIMIGDGFYYRILSMGEDSVKLANLRSKKIYVLVKERNQKLILRSDTTQYPYPKM